MGMGASFFNQILLVLKNLALHDPVTDETDGAFIRKNPLSVPSRINSTVRLPHFFILVLHLSRGIPGHHIPHGIRVSSTQDYHDKSIEK